MHPPASGTSSDDDIEPVLLNRQRRVRLRLPALREFLRRLQRQLDPRRAFSLCLVSDQTMRRYQRQFRGENAPTDVLSFGSGNGGRWAGDLLVSADTARRQARRLGHPTEAEIKILALHGLLHLLGYEHEAPHDATRMARAERRWRRRFALPESLTERARL